MPNSACATAHLQTLADFPGIHGCALVETATGMAWHVAGNYPELERNGKAAIQFWRIQQSLAGHLTALGPLKSAAYSFQYREVARFPYCDESGLVLVCVAAKGPVDWLAWGLKFDTFRGVVAQ